MEPVEQLRRCPRCGAVWNEGAAGGAPAIGVGCSACGLQLPDSALAELDYLTDLEVWAREKRAWIVDTAAAGGAVGAAEHAPAGHVAHAGRADHSARTPTAAGCLLSTGAFALVAAGLTFTAFAWGFLGAFGQLLVLVLAGAAAMVGGYLTARRIPGTANALSITGVLLLVVAAGFLLDADALGSPWFRAFGVAVAAGAGVAGSYRQSRRQPAAAVVTATFFAVLALVAVVTAPVLDAVDDVPSWIGWWIAGVLLVWGAALLALDAVSSRGAWRRVPWSWFGSAGLLVGVLVLAGVTGDRLDAADRFVDAPLLASSLILLVGAGGFLVLDRLSRARWWALPVGSMILMGAAALLVMSSVGDPSSRGWAVIPAVGLTLLLVAAAAHLDARPTFATARHEPVPEPAGEPAHVPDGAPTALQRWAGVLIRLSMVAAGGAVALLFTPTVDPPQNDFYCSSPPCVDPAISAWVDDVYPWWRGLAVGLAAVVVAVVAGLLVRRARSTVWSAAPVVLGVSTLAWWSWVVLTDASSGSFDSDPARSAVTAALVVGGLGLLAVFAALREPFASLWVAAGIAAVGGQVAWTWLALDDWSIGPELHSLFIAVPLLLAGMIVLLQRPHHHVSTWASVGPAIVAALVFPVAAVVDDMGSRWFDGVDPPTSALVRIVGLLLVGAVLVVVGARAHWSAVFWPGLVTVVVVAGAQVLDVASLLPQWLSLGVVGVILLVAGARWESVRLRGRRTRQWAGTLR